jgi:hypothetical protein
MEVVVAYFKYMSQNLLRGMALRSFNDAFVAAGVTERPVKLRNDSEC